MENNKTNTNHDPVQNILADIIALSDYIMRLKGLGIKVPEEVMVRGLEDIKTKYSPKQN